MMSAIAIAFALLVSLILGPLIKHRIVVRIASWRRKTASPPRLPSRDPFFNIDIVLEDFRDRKASRLVKSLYTTLLDLNTKTFELYPFGKRQLHTSDPRNVQFLLATEAERFGNGPAREVTVEMIGKGIINSDEEAWRRSRKLIMPTFTRNHIADREFFERHFERFLVRLPRDDRIVDLKPLFDQLVLDASSEFIFGESFDSQLGDENSVEGKSFLDAFTNAQFVVGMRLALGRLSALIPDDRFKKFRKNCEVFKSYTQRHVERALNRQSSKAATEKEEPYILVHELAKVNTNKQVLCDQLLNVFFAGRDAPAVALANIFFSLVRNPSVWERMRDETKELNPEDLSFEKLKSLRYVQYAINEGLRLYPALPLIGRTCLAETSLPYGGGPNGESPVAVVPGDMVVFNIYAMHRSADVFGPDVETYEPDRWRHIRPGWSYLPFSGGARHCPAQQLGLFWVSYVIVRLVMEFKEVQNMDPDEEFIETLKLNFEAANGVKVRLVQG